MKRGSQLSSAGALAWLCDRGQPGACPQAAPAGGLGPAAGAGVLPGPSQWWLDSVSELQVSGTPLPATRLGPVPRDTRDLTPPTPRPWLLSCPLHRREPLRRLTRFCSWAITLDHGTVCQAAIHQASVSPSVKWGNAVHPWGCREPTPAASCENALCTGKRYACCLLIKSSCCKT